MMAMAPHTRQYLSLKENRYKPGCGCCCLAHGKALREPAEGVRQYVPTPLLCPIEKEGHLDISGDKIMFKCPPRQKEQDPP